MQALFMQFPTDPMALDKDRQFMWGPSVMICPTLEQVPIVNSSDGDRIGLNP